MKYLKRDTVKRIHVDRRIVAINRKLPSDDQLPAITVQTSKGPHKARRVHVWGSGTFVQGEKPLSCGARIWFETYAEIGLE